MKPLYIFDLDGTLALNDHRLHLVRGEEKDWPAFFAACGKDEPCHAVIRTLDGLRRSGAEVWIWSGRSDEVREITIEWLTVHGIVDQRMMRWWEKHPDRFRMRQEGDHTPDVELKKKWLDELTERDRRRIVAVFDDRNSVVEMWRLNGVPCFQVAMGDF